MGSELISLPIFVRKENSFENSFDYKSFESAFRSNAINQEGFTLGMSVFQQGALTDFYRFNAGYFMAHYDDPEFDKIWQTVLLWFQLDAGLIYRFAFPLSLSASLGYIISLQAMESKDPERCSPFFYQLVYCKIK